MDCGEPSNGGARHDRRLAACAPDHWVRGDEWNPLWWCAGECLDDGYAGNAEEALRQLDDEHDRWVEGVHSLGSAGLAEPQGPTQPPAFADAPMAKLILYTNLEVIHHGAEICLLRDLYLRNGS